SLPLAPSSPLSPYTTLFRSERFQIQPVEELHHVIESAFTRDAEVVKLNRVRRFQRSRGACFARKEPEQSLGVLRSVVDQDLRTEDRKSTRLNSSHEWISYAV